ncbi:MAG TPA: helix-turn-helix domain-containing protein [Chlamydiales bacterium]|nr:helix-turn-helix domain-containing protein [Chlamydiales bacterium]
MAESMNDIGEMFRARRKERNLSLKEVENATSIRTNYLQSIEEGAMEKLISPIYAQGFVKQYAAFLELDGERIITENSEIFRQPIQQEFSYGIGTLEMRGNPGTSVKWMPNAIWIAAFFILVVLAYYLARTLEVI